MNVSDLYAKAGDDVAAWRDKLIRFIKERDIVSSGGARVSVMPGGTSVSFTQTSNSFAHPFTVSVQGKTCTVSNGTLNGNAPTIGGTPIDRLTPGGDAPVLTLKGAQNGKTWIAIRVSVDKTGALIDASIVEIDTLDKTILDRETQAHNGDMGYQPLAALYWSNGDATAFDIVYHNLYHTFIIGVVSRHLFWA